MSWIRDGVRVGTFCATGDPADVVGHTLALPRGWSWERLAAAGASGYELRDQDGGQAGSICEGSLVASLEDGELVDISGDEDLVSAMEHVELVVAERRHLPLDDAAIGADVAVAHLFSACARDAQRSLARRAMGSVSTDPLGIDFSLLVAADYALHYDADSQVAEAIQDAWVAHAGAARMTDLIEGCAVSHARADLEWCSEHFQARGSDEYDIDRVANEVETGPGREAIRELIVGNRDLYFPEAHVLVVTRWALDDSRPGATAYRMTPTSLLSLLPEAAARAESSGDALVRAWDVAACAAALEPVERADGEQGLDDLLDCLVGLGPCVPDGVATVEACRAAVASNSLVPVTSDALARAAARESAATPSPGARVAWADGVQR